MNWLHLPKQLGHHTLLLVLVCLFLIDTGINFVVGKLWSQGKLSTVNEGVLHTGVLGL